MGIKFSLVLFLLFVVSSHAGAYGVVEFPDENLYIAGNVGSYDEILQERATGAMFQLGYDLSRRFALEAHMGVTEDVQAVDTLTANAQVAHASLLLRGNLRKRDYTLFGFAGHGWVQSRTRFENSYTEKDSDHDLTYGAGVDLYGSYTSAMTFKWMRLIDAGNEGSFDAVYLGFTHYVNAKHDRPYRN